jgi:hypothetical protein
MTRPRFRLWALMVAIALVAVVLGGLTLRQRSILMSRAAVRHAEGEVEWTRRRDKYREVLADMRSQGPVRNFVFRSVTYESPERWEEAMGEVIAYHAAAKRAYERVAGRPWESLVLPASPEALSKHVEVEAALAEMARSK